MLNMQVILIWYFHFTALLHSFVNEARFEKILSSTYSDGNVCSFEFTVLNPHETISKCQNSSHMKVFQNIEIMIEGATDWYTEYYYHSSSCAQLPFVWPQVCGNECINTLKLCNVLCAQPLGSASLHYTISAGLVNSICRFWGIHHMKTSTQKWVNDWNICATKVST